MLGQEDKTHGIITHVELIDMQPNRCGGSRWPPPTKLGVVHLMDTPVRPGAVHGWLTGGKCRRGRRDPLAKWTCPSGVLAATEGAVAPAVSAHVALHATMVALPCGEGIWARLHRTEMQDEVGGGQNSADNGGLTNEPNRGRWLPTTNVWSRGTPVTQALGRDQVGS